MGKRYFPKLWHVQCGSGPEMAAKRTLFRKLLLGIERDLREERRGHQEGVWEGTCGASQVPPGGKLLDRLDAVCSRHSQSMNRVLLVTPVDSQIVLNTTVWIPWGDNFATPGPLPGSACALFELHGHGNED